METHEATAISEVVRIKVNLLPANGNEGHLRNHEMNSVSETVVTSYTD